MPWTPLIKAVICLRKNFAVQFSELFNALETVHRFTFYRSQGELTSLLCATKLNRCKDPQDRVFALLGLLSLRERLEFKANYSKSLCQVYTEFILQETAVKKSLQALTYCNIAFHDGSMPSWCPIW
jgi:hypothetical protein